MIIISYFTLKGIFVLKIFKFCLGFFGDIVQWFDKKAKVIFKTYDVTNWVAND